MDYKELSRYYARNMLKAGWAVRSLTATVILMMAVLAPVSVMKGYAAEMPEEESVAAVVELADYLDERELKSGTRLTRKQQADVLAAQLILKAREAEGNVTADMKLLERDGARLEGLEYRLKQQDSLTRKILADGAEKNISLDEAAGAIGDVLRYTLISEPDAYSQQVISSLRQLETKGYKIIKFRNAWGGKFYQGINVQLLSPQGVTVELQFHTAQSFAVKQASHEVYEIRRNPESTPEQVAEATELSIAYNEQVMVPKGAGGVLWPVPVDKAA